MADTSQPRRFLGGGNTLQDREALAARRQMMLQLVDVEGYTLQEVGQAYGISRERVRQIVGNRGHRQRRPDPVKLLGIARRASSMQQTVRDARVPLQQAKACLTALGALPALERLWRWRRGRAHGLRHLERMRLLGEQLGHAPTIQELMAAKIPFMSLVKYFGSVGNAQALLGYTPRKPGEPLDRERWYASLRQRRQHCRNGHLITGENRGQRADGRGFCRACERARQRRYYHAARARSVR